MNSYDVLIVEDDSALSEALAETLELEGFSVQIANHGQEALFKLKQDRYKLVISDVQMPVMDGFELLQYIRQQFADVPVLLMTAYGSIPKAVEAMQSGAVDYLIKPFEAEVLVNKVAALLVTPSASAIAEVRENNMKRLYTLAEKVAQTPVSVLLQGESGTGKEVLARYIHQHSFCRRGPFWAVNCAAIPENMLEAMLFGYEKGAFTGATQAVAGKFEQAQGGTLLLDEISEMELSLQAKLLRVLQEKEVERLGSHKKISLNVRVIATTNRQLKVAVDQGKFREDLYYRLSVFPLTIPPLRDRLFDIVPLAHEFIQKHHEKTDVAPVLNQSAIDRLMAYRWPGNVRELENVMQRALILQRNGTIGSDALVFDDESQILENVSISDASDNVTTVSTEQISIPIPNSHSLDDSVRSAEERIILQTLNEVNGSRKMTAEMLGISPRTLRYKLARMKEAGIAVPC